MSRRRQTDGGSDSRKSSPYIQVPREEQPRLIKQTGTLKNDPVSVNEPRTISISPQAIPDSDDDGEYPLAEEIFAATTLLIPMSFLLLMMYILIHFQYGQQPSWDIIANKMLSSVPILAVFIFYSEDDYLVLSPVCSDKFPANRHKYTRWAQASFFVLSVASGTRMIYQVNYSNWLVNMQQCPPLGTIWVYTILQLDLVPAVLALLSVGLWVWWTGVRLVFN
ncbi:hypothetical protein B0F90DRAFT_557364 [Multifurca ochricompacta]|uniref:DUF7719 domain-containing protein n=1 Tax=Multifurca ochricompacta TaxID=376703 RepID=A0AAD4MBI3_9AGAM|nr:hypothetical protein B0F90DRAFT_557364 [Multifurca ochricompacta]